MAAALCRTGRLLVLLALSTLSSGQDSGQDYCKIRCNGRPHTMCSYGPGGRNGCSESQLSARDQNVILRAHNQRRREIKNGKYSSRGLPAAAEMPDLRWDPELAKIAQRWANQCQQAHDDCRKKNNGLAVGQNAAWTWGSPKNLAAQVKSWFDEINQWSGGVDFQFSENTGHFTQIIWADTTAVGCGLASGPNNMLALFCNYAPAGNIIGSKIYQPARGGRRPQRSQPDTRTPGNQGRFDPPTEPPRRSRPNFEQGPQPTSRQGDPEPSGDILTVLPYLKEPREGEILHSNEGDMLPHAQVTRRGEARVRDGEGEVRRSEQGRIVRDGDRVSASASASASAKQHRRQQPDGGARPSYSTTTRRPTRNTRRTRQPSSYRQTTTRRPQRTTTYRRPTTRRPEQQRPDDTNRPQQRPDDRYKTDQKPDDGYKSGERVYRPDGRQEGDVRRSGQWRVIRGRPVVLHQAQDGAGQQRQIIIGPSGRRHVVEDVRVQRQRVEQVSPSDDIVRQLSPILDHIPQGEGIKRKIFSNSTQFSQGVNRVIQTITVS
ncbi:uncharacterized protein LOC122394411 [Amphibalanus amphitrite]|uniref:uncharacterized protein LOC122394411 n=1 Tax=Amphibalanus amphitrite TaxID=1232801 RepID=UPI001C908ED9|nr:uncharacterized protein LOC122394411 [Amphibalanus amphitrite]